MNRDILFEGLKLEDLKPEARETFSVHQAIKQIMADVVPPTSLEELHLEDVLVEPNPFPVDWLSHDLSTQQMLLNRIREVFAPLDDIEKQVLSMRFGFAGGRERTLKEVGVAIGKSKSTAWRIEHQALAKLRTPELTVKMQEAFQ